MRARNVWFSFAVFFLLGGGVLQAADLMEAVTLGSFGTSFPTSTSSVTGSYYEVTWDQISSPSGLVDPAQLPWICSAGTPQTPDCVYEIRINLRTTQPYKALYFTYERAGAEVDEIVFDNNKVGGVAAPGYRYGSVTAAESQWVTVSFALGMVTPQKTHTVIIRSPDKGAGDGRFFIAAVKIVGVPPSSK